MLICPEFRRVREEAGVLFDFVGAQLDSSQSSPALKDIICNLYGSFFCEFNMLNRMHLTLAETDF